MKKVREKLIAISLGLILGANPAISCYSSEIVPTETASERTAQLKDVVYLTEGQGPASQGSGTAQNPYTNIKTALNNVKPGGTIKIVGKFNYWVYEETPDLLYRPLIIDKEVTIEGAGINNPFLVRAPIQLAADVKFKNINLQMWASNELMPGVPDFGLPQTPVDEGTKFRSGRTIFLAGHKLTLENVDTHIYTDSFQNEYYPYISAGTFIEGGKTGDKAVLEVIDPNVYLPTGTITGTVFQGIYAGDYWVERDYPVELNIKGLVLDKTIYTGGIMASSKSDVTINLSKLTGVNTINTDNHNGSVTVNINDGASLSNAELNGITNLNIGSGSIVELKKDSKFEVENLTLRNNSLLDFREISGNPKVTGNFTGETNNALKGGSIYLDNGKVLEINGDVEGTTLLNSFRVETILLQDNATYIKAKENATGNFIIEPKFEQRYYNLIKDTNDQGYTTWKTFRDINVFKEFRWVNDNDNVILDPEAWEDYYFDFELINSKDEVYDPAREDWEDITITLTREDGTVLDENNDSDEEIEFVPYSYNEEGGRASIIMFYPDFIKKNTPEELILKIAHKDGSAITKRIYVGKEKPDVSILDVAKVANKYNLRKGEDGYSENYDFNKDDIIDIYDLTIISQYINK